MSILARLNALSNFNQSSGFVECPNAWQRTCVRGAHFDVDIHMALLMVNKVYEDDVGRQPSGGCAAQRAQCFPHGYQSALLGNLVLDCTF